jgi:hypothetical protein
MSIGENVLEERSSFLKIFQIEQTIHCPLSVEEMGCKSIEGLLC